MLSLFSAYRRSKTPGTICRGRCGAFLELWASQRAHSGWAQLTQAAHLSLPATSNRPKCFSHSVQPSGVVLKLEGVELDAGAALGRKLEDGAYGSALVFLRGSLATGARPTRLEDTQGQHIASVTSEGRKPYDGRVDIARQSFDARVLPVVYG